MKNFLYLRVNAIVGIIASLIMFTITLVNIIIFEYNDPKMLLGLMAAFVFILPAIHNFQIIYIYRKHFPAEEISKLSRTCNTVFALLCLFIFLSITTFSIYVVPYFDIRQYDIHKVYSLLVIIAIYLITILIQVTGSFRLIKKIRAGARQQLDSSFV